MSRRRADSGDVKPVLRVRDDDVVADIDDEIAFHLDERIADFVAQGLSDDEAKKRALEQFGDVAASRAELADVDRRRWARARAVDVWSGLVHDLRHATRGLARAPWFSLAALATLVIGIGATTATFSVLNGVLFQPLPYAHADRLVGTWHDMPPINLYHTQQAAQTYFTYRTQARTIDGIGLYRESAANVSIPSQTTDPARLTIAGCTASLLSVLGTNALLGRVFAEADDQPWSPRVALLSEGYWRSQFGGDSAVIGKEIDVDGVRRQIVGVLPRWFQIPSVRVALWVPLNLDPANPPPDAFTFGGIARLRSGVSVEAAQRDFANVLPRAADLSAQFVPGISMREILEQTKPRPVLTPLAHDVTASIAPVLWALAGAAFLIYLAGCVNVGNLVLVRFSVRQSEIAVRQTLGATTARAVQSFVAELAILSFVAALGGIAVTWAIVTLLKHAGPDIPRLAELTVDWRTIVFAALVACGSAIACALVPVARIRRGLALVSRVRGGTGLRADQALRRSLVIVQIAFAVVVMAGAGLLMRSYTRLQGVHPGFDAGRVETFWVSLPSARYGDDSAVVRFYTRLVDEAGALPGVIGAAVTSRLPLIARGLNDNPIYPEGAASADTKLPPLQLFTTVGGDYFSTMRVPLLAGRTFDEMARQREGDAVISSRVAATFWHDPSGRAAIGKRFRVLPTSHWYNVIGVVADVHDSSLATPASPTVYFPQTIYTDPAQHQTKRTMALAVRMTAQSTNLAPALQRLARQIDPSLPVFDVRPMSAALAESSARLRFVTLMLGGAALVTALLGAIGLYGLMAYVVTLRRREFAIRVALGAPPRSLATATTSEALRMTSLGLVCGLVLFIGAARVVRALLFDVSTFDPITLIGTVVALGALALTASWVPAHRSAQVNPAETLRAE